MSFYPVCPHCGVVCPYEAGDANIGQEYRCLGCNRVYQIVRPDNGFRLPAVPDGKDNAKQFVPPIIANPTVPSSPIPVKTSGPPPTSSTLTKGFQWGCLGCMTIIGLCGVLFLLLFLIGLITGNNHTKGGMSNHDSIKPYTIIDRMSGTAQITVYVEVPVGASQSEMAGWAKEIEAHEGSNRSVMINFYNGGRGADKMIGSYQGGTLYDTR